jgi:hypothetical protein
MRAERLEADLDVMQRSIAEKDAELAHGYRLLEASAGGGVVSRCGMEAYQVLARSTEPPVGLLCTEC